MTRTRTSLNLATLSAAVLLSAAFVPLARRNTVFTDYTGTDPLLKKSTLSIEGDATDNAGGPGTEDKKSDSDGTGVASATQLQAENVAGGTKQADAIDDAGAGNKAAVGDPPAGTEQQS